MKTNINSHLVGHSPIARLTAKPRDVRNQELPAKRIVCHITGTSTYINAAKRQQPPLARIEDYFDNVGNPFAHYTIDPWGRVVQHASERERAWSQGWGGLGGRTGALNKVAPSWWVETHGVDGIAKLFPAEFGIRTPNDRAVSIEFIQFQHGEFLAPRRGRAKKWASVGPKNYKLTIAQYFMGNLLMHDIALRHGMTWPIPTPHEHIARAACGFLGHEDCDPWGRGHAKSGGWDPGALRKQPRFCWFCILTLDFARCGCNCVIPTPVIPEWAREA